MLVPALTAQILATGLSAAPGPAAPPLRPWRAAGDGVLAEAESLVGDDGAAARVLEAGELRMLGQRIATAACAWLAGVAGAEADLRASVARFDRVIAGLEGGDPGLGIPTPETDRRVLADIAAAHAIWDPLHVVLDRVLAEGPTRADVLHIAERSLPLLAATDHLASVISGEYSDPTQLLQVDAIAIDIAARQETLAEEMAKDICLLALRLGDATAERAELSRALTLFEASLTALQDGMPEAGVAPPPTDAIRAELARVRAEWAPVRGTLAAVAGGGAVPEGETARIYHALTVVTDHMVDIAKLYAEASRLGL